MQKAKNLDDHVPSLKRKRKGNVWVLTDAPFCFKLNHDKEDQEARNRNGRQSKESSKTDVKIWSEGTQLSIRKWRKPVAIAEKRGRWGWQNCPTEKEEFLVEYHR